MTRLAYGKTELAAPRLVVPAYFHPLVHPEQWALMAERADQVHLVILNLANGPGISFDASHLPAVQRLQEAGVSVAGYVDTNYGRRPIGDAVADLGRYLEWYGVSGVCFDRVAVDAENLALYAELAGHARAMGAQMVTFNHGAHPLEAYAEHADLLCTFEGPWHAYLEASVPRWTRSLPAEKFYHVVYSVPRKHFGEAYLFAARRNAGSAFITDHGGPNPYQCLPSDWPEAGEL